MTNNDIETGLDVGSAISSQVTLPVYFHWEFRTGTGGDFEALVGLLEARDSRDMPPEVGKRPMDISHPGFSTTPPLPSDTVLELEGALRRLDADHRRMAGRDSNAVSERAQKDPRCAVAGLQQRRQRPAAGAADLRLLAGSATHRGHDSRSAGIADLAG